VLIVSEPSAEVWSSKGRYLAAGAGAVLAGLLGVAIWLTPASSGLGTHRQLGLPPCTFFVWFGIPCPSCGMTTSWSLLVRGRVGEALHANVGGTCLALLAMAAVPWLWISAWRGRAATPLLEDRAFTVAVSLLLAVTVAQWAIRVLQLTG
jgi:hypothetical protein